MDIAVIGTGWTDKVQIPAFQAAGLTVVAVASGSLERAREVAARHGVPHAVGDWREVLELEPDLVSVASPPARHHEQALAVLEAGCHLLCEKPLALNAAEAAAMARAASERPGLLALVDHELRFTPARLKARELLRAGVIGRLLTVTARIATDDWTDPARPWSWWSDRAQGGGVLGALGSHALDGIRWLTGEEPRLRGATLGTAYPTRRDRHGEERPVTSDEICSLTFELGGAVGTALVHAVALDEKVDLLTLRGTEGTLAIDTSLRLYLGRGTGPLKEYRTQLPPEVPNRFRASPFAAGTVLLGQALLAWERGDADALAQAATLEDGLAAQRLIDTARVLADGPAPGPAVE